ncbi:MaoC/PaaZ C-terminal domain-containing protein [Streptomyces sp. CA-210063]|uniref:MaoC family dehydratase n=1 Tax=Streptomyces sp. CA-210063 TaxID=2801029 RepID=UPI00214CFBAA|nr:MaoC/PaaZ C-terminal domain-containing protein [Streptomyces sp. CA-210063]UUU31649.1 MaoC/PaaZ C-terminal domain-containing protein [Streptomyces sp. CA-210063]
MHHTRTLTDPPSLSPLLARGALLSPCKSLRLPRTAAGYDADADAAIGPARSTRFPRLALPGVRIDLVRLAAYERVCGFPTGEDAVPLTYPHVLGFPLAMRIMSGRDFPLPLLGLVHTSIEITRRRRLPATGEYEITVYVDELAPHRRGTSATVVTEVRDGSGYEGGAGGGGGRGVAWESRSTYLARHRRGEDARTGGSERPREEREPLPAVAEWRLAGDVGRRYGAVSGDRNPIHLHPLGARLFGFPRAIAHGMWTVARCLAEHGTPPAALVRAEFRAPVPLPSTVTYAADGQAWGGFELRSGGLHTSADGAPDPGGERLHVRGYVYPLVA